MCHKVREHPCVSSKITSGGVFGDLRALMHVLRDMFVRSKILADFKRRVQAEIKERKDKETERLAAHAKKRSEERIARRSTILKFWGQAQVSHGGLVH